MRERECGMHACERPARRVQLVEHVLEFYKLGLLPPSMTELADFSDQAGCAAAPSKCRMRPTLARRTAQRDQACVARRRAT